MPTVTAYDADGRLVDQIDHVDMRPPFAHLPWPVRIRFALTGWRHKGEWFNYVPRR